MSNSFVFTWTIAHQSPLFMEFPRQEYLSGLPFPIPGHLPDPGRHDWTHVSCISSQVLYIELTGMPPFFLVVVRSLSCVWYFATPWTAAYQSSLSYTISRSLLKLMSFESMRPSNHLILCCPFSSCPQSFPASGSFPMNGQSIGASASVVPMNI